MDTWLDRNWYWLVGLGLGIAYFAISILIPRDENAPLLLRIARWNPLLDTKAWTPRALILTVVMIVVALVAIVFFPGGRR